MTRPGQRKLSSVEQKRQQLRQAHSAAPTLQVLLPAATQVSVELTFALDTQLAPAPRTVTVFPPARAHFVYACPFGNCDGAFDLDAEILGILHAGTCQATGVRSCCGHRANGNGYGPRCGLGLTYAVTVRYGATQPGAAPQPARTG